MIQKKFSIANAITICVICTSFTYALAERGTTIKKQSKHEEIKENKKEVIKKIKKYQPIKKRYYDNHPNIISENDMKVLETFDTNAYKIAEREYDNINIDRIYNFILRHKAHQEEYNKLKITSTLDVGSRTRNPYSNSYNYSFDDGKQFYSAYVELSYPIWDKKTEKRIANEKLTYNLQILDNIEKYVEVFNDVLNYREELELLRMKQRVWKDEYISGVKYRDERLQLLESLRKSKVNLRASRHKLNKLKLYLFTMTTNPKGLNKLLGGNI